jgi:hypothetical protein
LPRPSGHGGPETKTPIFSLGNRFGYSFVNERLERVKGIEPSSSAWKIVGKLNDFNEPCVKSRPKTVLNAPIFYNRQRNSPARYQSKKPGQVDGRSRSGGHRIFFHLPHLSASGSSSRAISSSPARVAGWSASSGWRTASLPMTPPSAMTVLAARRPHWRFS